MAVVLAVDLAIAESRLGRDMTRILGDQTVALVRLSERLTALDVRGVKLLLVVVEHLVQIIALLDARRRAGAIHLHARQAVAHERTSRERDQGDDSRPRHDPNGVESSMLHR